jgi:lipid A 3-O-deacylase
MGYSRARSIPGWMLCACLSLVQPASSQDSLTAFKAGDTASFPMKACNTEGHGHGVPAAGWNFVWENDSIVPAAPTDEEYTQGLQFGYRFRPDQQPRLLARPMGAICRWLAAASDADHQALRGAGSLFIGQHIFTPGDGDSPTLVDDDRPYAAWLYLGARLEVAQPFTSKFAKTGLFHTFELQVGTLGPRAQGEWVQNHFHELIGSDPLLGWGNGLSNEWGIQGLYKIRALAHKWTGRMAQADATVGADVNIGTIQILGGGGANFRLGRNLSDPVAEPLGPTFEGAGINRAGLAAPDVSEPNGCLDGRWIFAIKECYVYVGVSGRATAFDAFLDGGMFNGGHSVDRDPFTYDWSWGARLRWSRFQFDYTAVNRSREFSPLPAMSQSRDGKHKYGAVNVRCFAPIGSDTKRWDLVCPAFFLLLLGAVAAQ